MKFPKLPVQQGSGGLAAVPSLFHFSFCLTSPADLGTPTPLHTVQLRLNKDPDTLQLSSWLR